jgi:hypothetical protein
LTVPGNPGKKIKRSDQMMEEKVSFTDWILYKVYAIDPLLIGKIGVLLALTGFIGIVTLYFLALL